MATIQKLMNKKGLSYRVQIRRKGLPNIFKTFTNKQEARRFALRIEDSKSAHRAYSSKLTFNTLVEMYLSNEYLGTKPQMQRSRLRHWLNHIRILVSEESLCLGTENPIFDTLEYLK